MHRSYWGWRAALAVTVILFATACQGGAAPHGASNTPVAPARDAYTLVLLKTGEATSLSRAQQQEALGGHFANMERLASEQKLVLAGPYGRETSDADLRGVFVLATGDRAQAKQWAETDPGYQVGMFRLEYHDFVTGAPLKAFLQAEADRQERFKQEGRTPAPGENARGYVWLTMERADMPKISLDLADSVLMLAELDADRVTLLLDANNLAEAKQLLRRGGMDAAKGQLDEWFASDLLVEMRWPRIGGYFAS